MAKRNVRRRRVLDPERVVLTLDQLHARIAERFPASGLARVCADLAEVAKKTQMRALELSRPYYGLRLLTAVVVIAAVGVQIYVGRLVDWSSIERRTDTVALTHGLESAVNLAILAFGAIWCSWPDGKRG